MSGSEQSPLHPNAELGAKLAVHDLGRADGADRSSKGGLLLFDVIALRGGHCCQHVAEVSE